MPSGNKDIKNKTKAPPFSPEIAREMQKRAAAKRKENKAKREQEKTLREAAQEQGIDTTGMSPKEVWEALAKKGITENSVNEKKAKEIKDLQSKSIDELKDMAKKDGSKKFDLSKYDDKKKGSFTVITNDGKYKELRATTELQAVLELLNMYSDEELADLEAEIISDERDEDGENITVESW